jgi:hypothetical protein
MCSLDARQGRGKKYNETENKTLDPILFHKQRTNSKDALSQQGMG